MTPKGLGRHLPRKYQKRNKKRGTTGFQPRYQWKSLYDIAEGPGPIKRIKVEEEMKKT